MSITSAQRLGYRRAEVIQPSDRIRRRTTPALGGAIAAALICHDYSKLHNFALGSQTANKRLFTGSIPGVSTKSYTLRLKPGRYAYACSAHFQTMNGTFTVT